MIFLFEEHPYDSEFLQKAIGYTEGDNRSDSGFNTDSTEEGITIKGVGYCFYNGQPVFVLPKVFVYKGNGDNAHERAFDIRIDKNGLDVFGAQSRTNENGRQETALDINRELHHKPLQRFLSSLSVWLYSAIYKYKKEGGKGAGVRTPSQDEARDFKKNNRSATLLDIMSSMELFYKKNQSLFVFVAINKNSGNHKINWTRTVNKKTPFIQDGVPIYMDTVNKVKVFDLDDRLLVLYFSAMKYIQDKYGYTMPQSEFYQPLKMHEIERLLENERGLRELKRIKYKYFEDRLLKLYNIMEAFFQWGARYKSKGKNAKEYLIANSFNNVFEAMIDELVSDPDVVKLKRSKDNKIIDHLYKEKSLIFASTESTMDNIWFIGDSKYYSDIGTIGEDSIFKQYTYAENIRRDFFSHASAIDDRHPSQGIHQNIYMRDNLTEGYNIIPNFFISGHVPKYSAESQYTSDYFTENPHNDELIRLAKKTVNGVASEENMINYLWDDHPQHFENRLFDRDTLLLQAYDVNFLYVLKAYTSKQSSLRNKFKTEAREKFRNNFVSFLEKKFNFYKIIPQGNVTVQEFVRKRFWQWRGKMFCPENVPDHEKTFIIYAEEKQDDPNNLLNATTSNQRYREIEGDRFICLPLSARGAMGAVSDRDLNPDIFVTKASQELYDKIDREGIVELPRRNVLPDLRMSVPKYLLVIDDADPKVRLFIVISMPDRSDSLVQLHLLEQKSYVEKVFDCDDLVARADEFVDRRMRWNDLPWR